MLLLIANASRISVLRKLLPLFGCSTNVIMTCTFVSHSRELRTIPTWFWTILTKVSFALWPAEVARLWIPCLEASSDHRCFLQPKGLIFLIADHAAALLLSSFLLSPSTKNPSTWFGHCSFFHVEHCQWSLLQLLFSQDVGFCSWMTDFWY